jgi:molybdopterin/thiamine biosynthesis adenylyltransferase
MADVGRNFYANANQIGKATRAEASITQLKELNPNCTVNVSSTDDAEWMYKIYLSK